MNVLLRRPEDGVFGNVLAEPMRDGFSMPRGRVGVDGTLLVVGVKADEEERDVDESPERRIGMSARGGRENEVRRVS